MTRSVICQSCGQRIELAVEFTRRKVRCPECGVMCEVTEAAQPSTPRAPRRPQEPAPPDAEELARQLWSTPDPAPTKQESRPAKPVRKDKREEPADAAEAPPAVPPHSSAVTWTEEDEDSSGYDVSGGLPITCPQCHKELQPGTALCVGCGLELKSGKKKAALHYQPFQRYWEPGLSYESRLNLYLTAVGIGLLLSIGTAIFVGPWYISFGPWLGFVVMLAFLLGTFNRVDLARDRRGNARLTQTWRVFFIRKPTQTLDLREYDSVVTGRSLDAGCYEWFIMFILLSYFIVPGVLWWYHVIHKSKFHAALARSHGYPEVTLYRGNSQERAEEIAEALRDAAHLGYDRS